MTIEEIIRAWKDKAYRESLTAAQQALLPDNPGGLIELSDIELGLVVGGDEGTIEWHSHCCEQQNDSP